MKLTLLLTLLPALATAQARNPAAATLGRITGQVTYPSEYFPANMVVTAVPVAGKGHRYTTTKYWGQHHSITQNYSLRLPAGTYYVYAATNDLPGYKSYYTKFVTCGLSSKCPSHAKIAVAVKAGATTTRIDPDDWYVPDPHPAADSLGQ
jgi:hypothetical protein